MTSFISKTFGYVAHQPQTVTAVLATARPLMNSSIVPVTLSDDEVWDRLCTMNHHPPKNRPVFEILLKLFLAFSDTMQFTERLKFDFRYDWNNPPDGSFLQDMLQDLVENKKYFSRTVKSITNFPSVESIEICAGKLSNLRSFVVSDPSSVLRDSDLALICAKFNRITTLVLNNVLRRITDKGFKEIAKLRFLEHLDLSSQDLKDLSFLKDLTKLQTLNLEACQCLVEENLFGEEVLLVTLSSLHTITFKNTEIKSYDAFHRLQQIAPNLTSLSCSGIEPGAEEAIGKMEYLRHLTIVGSDFLTIDTDFLSVDNSEPLFKTLSSNLEFLESLYVDGLSNFDSCLGILSKSSVPLKRLRFGHCVDFSDAGFCSLATLPDLEVLEIENQSGFTCDLGENTSSSSKSFPSLKKLHLTACGDITDRGIQSVLRLVSLSSFVLSECELITDEGLRIAFKNSNTRFTLEKMVKNDFGRLNGSKSLNWLKQLKFLKELSLWNNQSLSNRALFEIIPTLEQLEVFSVSTTFNGAGICSVAIRKAVENLRWLKKLEVSGRIKEELKDHPKLVFVLSARET